MKRSGTTRTSLLRSSLVLAVIILLAGCGSSTVKELEQKNNARPMKAPEILKLVDSNTLFLESFNESTYYYFDHSGKLFGTDIYNNTDYGQWDVTDTDELCMKLHWWWYGDLRCYPVLTDGTRYYLANSAGVLTFKAAVYTGDYKKQYRNLDKKRKKSYRRSIRNEQKTPPVTPPAARPEPDIREPETGPQVPSMPNDELKSTVQWMARDCAGCNLAGANLTKADLVAAQLKGADLAGADLSMANLRRADLQDANLEDANLFRANLPGANLQGADLTGANLEGANLIRANLTGADIHGANFKDALLEGVIGLTLP